MKINKYGLSRNVPAEVKRIIRKKDGYGCIFCGKIFIQYEHIDPQWSDAKEHDASKMALLCSSCHDEVTHKRISKIRVTKAKEDPFCKRNGFANGKFYPHPENMKIQIGNSIFGNTDIAITFEGKPLIWVTRDIHDENCPLQYSGIFFDSTGRKIAYLNKNTFIALIADCDFQAIESRIEVRAKEREINLVLKIQGDENLEITKINYKINNTKIILNNKKEIVINNNITLGEIHTDSCFNGLTIGHQNFYKNRYTSLFNAITLTKCTEITNIYGRKIGYLLNDKIVDLESNITGYIDTKSNKVFTLAHDYIGVLNESGNKIIIVMYSDEHDDQEPIWVSLKNKKMQMFLSKPLFDTSYRLFGYNSIN